MGKKALDKCDKAGVDKAFTVSYPDSCKEEKAAFDDATNDFVRFLEGKEAADVVIPYDKKVADLFAQKGEVLAALTTLQDEYKEDLLKVVAYDAAIHNNEDVPSSYKSPDEMKDIQKSFSMINDELDALAVQVEANLRALSVGSSKSFATQAAELNDLKQEEASLQDAYDACKAGEDKRLADVPAPVLKAGTSFYENELKIKEEVIAATCSAYAADLANTQALMAGNEGKYDALKTATDDSFATASETTSALEEFAETGQAKLQASITERVEDDDALPIVIIAAAGGGGLLLIIIVIVVASSGGNKGGNAGYSGSWGDQTSSVVAFENPVYDDNGDMGGYEDDGQQDDGGGLYDEPEMFAEDNGAGGGYLDVAPDDDEEDEGSEEEDEESEEDESGEDESGDDDDDDDDDESDDDDDSDDE